MIPLSARHLSTIATDGRPEYNPQPFEGRTADGARRRFANERAYEVFVIACPHDDSGLIPISGPLYSTGTRVCARCGAFPCRPPRSSTSLGVFFQ